MKPPLPQGLGEPWQAQMPRLPGGVPALKPRNAQLGSSEVALGEKTGMFSQEWQKNTPRELHRDLISRVTIWIFPPPPGKFNPWVFVCVEGN